MDILWLLDLVEALKVDDFFDEDEIVLDLELELFKSSLDIFLDDSIQSWVYMHTRETVDNLKKENTLFYYFFFLLQSSTLTFRRY